MNPSRAMKPIRVVMVSKALVVGAYQRKAEEIARHGVELTVLTPPAWGDGRARQVAERRHTRGYELRTVPVRFNGNFHLYYYPTLAKELDRLQPDILHMDEEPYNLATWLGIRAAVRRQIMPLFFTWQNLYRRYPPPFSWLEQSNYRKTPAAIAGNQEAASVLRCKGYAHEVLVIPQFGVDPDLFCPQPAGDTTGPDKPGTDKSGTNGGPDPEPFVIGYAGRLVPEKGIDLLLRACAELCGPWRLRIVGEGSERAALLELAAALDVTDRVQVDGQLNSAAMPAYYRTLDALALPSRTTSRWKEQFGRVLIEAMACAVPVVGSDSGEIPHVIGDAGHVFPEGDAGALRAHLQTLLNDPALRAQLGRAGRARVLAHYTMDSIARQTVDLYRRMMRNANRQI